MGKIYVLLKRKGIMTKKSSLLMAVIDGYGKMSDLILSAIYGVILIHHIEKVINGGKLSFFIVVKF